jgi:hypothetical protein
MDRKRPRGSSGVLAALLIAPRTFSFCVCQNCLHSLYYTYVGEECPHCGARVTAECYVEGELPEQANRLKLDFRARGREPGSGASAAGSPTRRVTRRGGRRRPSANAAGAAG